MQLACCSADHAAHATSTEPGLGECLSGLVLSRAGDQIGDERLGRFRFDACRHAGTSNAYGELPSNLIFPMGHFPRCCGSLLTVGTPRRSGHLRRCVAFIADIAKAEWRERKQDSEDHPNINAHQSNAAAVPLHRETKSPGHGVWAPRISMKRLEIKVS